MKLLHIAPLAFVLTLCSGVLAQRIDRKAVVGRHNVIVSSMDTLSSLTVGNGRFAFTVDATGLQSFPEYYAKGIPLGTQSEWGWHSFPNKDNFRFDETLKEYDFNGRPGMYAVQKHQSAGRDAATDFFRLNPHRLQLGNVGLMILKKDGTEARPEDIKEISQELDLWTGIISSSFRVEGVPVKVVTCSDQESDVIAVKVSSDLLKEQRIKLRLRFPFPASQFKDEGVNYASPEAHSTNFSKLSALETLFTRKLDSTTYFVKAKATTGYSIQKKREHDFYLSPANTETFAISVCFSSGKPGDVPLFSKAEQASVNGWSRFWNSGAAVDFSGCTDVRAPELERRVILSQYLTRVQCAGNYPPQETGLTYNSWFGRPHMEMYWWHAAHFAPWGRTELLEKSIQWYFKAYKGAEVIAKRQGFKGVRWQKMTDHEGGEGPSSIGSFLIWQQPHPIYLAELIYRNSPSEEVLVRYKDIIAATADFMTSFAVYDSAKQQYNLGKGIIPAQECFDPASTYNPPFELAYWKYALHLAQNWNKRLGLPVRKDWDDVMRKMAPLAKKDSVYLVAESTPESYSQESKYLIDHPAVLSALGVLPMQDGYTDTAIMSNTFTLIKKIWNWDHTWGWDFPMVAMTATRLHRPEDAIDALFKNVTTNTYLKNGHNYQDKRLTLYLPGNGGLLSVIALMTAGFDGNTVANPGFPKNGKWNVKWEGFKPMP